MEFKESAVMNSTDTAKGSGLSNNDTLKRFSPPVLGMPRRF